MQFTKYHALGNDYLVLNPADCPSIFNDVIIERVCHRNYGLGSDGILYGPLPSERASFGLRIFNPDSSEAEKSGNGLRIFCRYLYDLGKVGTESFTIETSGGIVTARIIDPEKSIQVEMGKVSFHSQDVPVTIQGQPREVILEEVVVDDTPYQFCAATIGNPHCVLPLNEITPEMAYRIGPFLENFKIFPNRTNVQLLKVLDRSNIQIEIWERGAGYTLASGSSSSAAAAVAHRIGSCDSSITVHMPGGKIKIEIGEDYSVTMTGGVTPVGIFHAHTSLLV